MKISVIVPFQKGKKYLADCLESLAKHCFDGTEVLLILDQGAEDIKGLSEGYQTKLTLKVFELHDGAGVAAARNLGVRKAQGEFLFFIDSDDYLDAPLHQLYSVAVEHNADVVYGELERTWFQRALYLQKITPPKSASVESEEISLADSEDRKNYLSKTYELQYNNYVNMTHSSSSSEEERQKAEQFLAAHDLLVEKKDIRDVSILGLLLKREFWEKEQLEFDENYKYFSDLPVVLKILEKGRLIKKASSFRYVKRRHNDPIHLPSLVQQSLKDGYDERLQVYSRCMETISNRFLNRQLQLKIFNYVWNELLAELRSDVKKKQKKAVKEKLESLQLLFGNMTLEDDDFSLADRKRLYRRVQKHRLNGVLRIAEKREWKRQLQLFRHSKLEIGKYIYLHYYMKLPIRKNIIMFESFSGKYYSDSPKYISEYINAHYPGQYKLVWAVNQKKPQIPYPYKKVKRYSMAYLYYLAVSHYFVFNGRQAGWMKKREGQVFLETWHGTPLKKLFFDMEDITSATPTCKQEVYEQAKDWDYLVSPNSFSTEVFRRCFRYDNEMVESGYPRNDLLHAKNREELSRTVKKKLGIPEDKTVILYAPTWRDDEYYTSGRYKFTLPLDLEQMREQLGNEYVLLLRTHYYIADSIDTRGYEGFAYNVSAYEDISELYLISDLLVTDYSSVFFDYANLKRPMIFFTYDLEKYRDMIRGFYIDMEKELPGPMVYDTQGVIDTVRTSEIWMEERKEQYQRFYERFCAWEDGNASERVVKALLSKKR